MDEQQRREERLLSAAARALERCEVATDPSGAADEAAAILGEVVTLDGTYVEARAPLTLEDRLAAANELVTLGEVCVCMDERGQETGREGECPFHKPGGPMRIAGPVVS